MQTTFFNNVREEIDRYESYNFVYAMFILAVIAGIAGYTLNELSISFTLKNVMQLIISTGCWFIGFDWLHDDIYKERC